MSDKSKEELSSAVYVNKYGMENRITCFRCSTFMRDRLDAYAKSVGKEPSEIIREAIGEYLRNRSTTPTMTNTPSLSGWSAKSTKV